MTALALPIRDLQSALTLAEEQRDTLRGRFFALQARGIELQEEIAAQTDPIRRGEVKRRARAVSLECQKAQVELGEANRRIKRLTSAISDVDFSEGKLARAYLQAAKAFLPAQQHSEILQLATQMMQRKGAA